MAGKEELLAEPVTQFPSYDRSHHTFKDKNKKNLACDDITKQVDYPNSKKILRKVSLFLFCILVVNTRFFCQIKN